MSRDWSDGSHIYGADGVHDTNIFATGCDMPLLNIDLIRHMTSLLSGYSAVTPLLHRMTEPLHSIYSKDAAFPSHICSGKIR